MNDFPPFEPPAPAPDVPTLPPPPPAGPPAPGWWLASDGRWYPPAARPAYPQGYGFSAQPVTGTNGLAIAALVLGILWLYWIGSILAVVFGHVALVQTKRTGQGGRGLAIAGLVLGYIGLGVLALGLIGLAAGVGDDELGAALERRLR